MDEAEEERLGRAEAIDFLQSLEAVPERRAEPNRTNRVRYDLQTEGGVFLCSDEDRRLSVALRDFIRRATAERPDLPRVCLRIVFPMQRHAEN